MKYGYTRVSTKDKQTFDRQDYELLSQVPDLKTENIYRDKISGTKRERPGLNALLEVLKEGDELYVTELSRLSRTLDDLLELIKLFEERKITFKSIKEAFVFESDSPLAKVIIVIIAAIADLERTLITERIKSGVACAKERGVSFGRPKVPEQQIADALKLYDSKQYTVRRILDMTKISKSTFYRALRVREQEQQQDNHLTNHHPDHNTHKNTSNYLEDIA